MNTPPMPADVSVVMPTWNRIQFLRSALDSVLMQSVPIRELIIADDGSDAPARALLQEYAARPGVRVLWRDHCGNPGAVRNAAIHEASGRYVAFADSDDIWEPRKLERQLEALRARPQCRWSYSAVTFVDARGQTTPPPGTPDPGLRGPSLVDALACFETGVALPSVLVERGLLLESGLFDEKLTDYEDCDLWLRLASSSEPAAIPEPLVMVRLHDTRYSRRDARAALSGREEFLARALCVVRTPAVRTRLQRMRALDSARLAELAARAGHAGEAASRLRGSLADGWSTPRWWIIAARAYLRALTITTRETSAP